MSSGPLSTDSAVANQGIGTETNPIVNGPITDSDSKTVMVAAERGDEIHISEVISKVEGMEIPDEFSVIQRTDTYYGPKLFVHSRVEGEERNFLLTAPGPDSQLRLWTEEMSSTDKRKGWSKAAEVTAVLPAEQPPYGRCEECGELIRSVEHERAALTGNCNRAESWG
jgi:hypothetical protein